MYIGTYLPFIMLYDIPKGGFIVNSMIEDFFLNIVKNLPNANVPFPGVQAWVIQGPESQVVFFEIEKSTFIPPHSHGPQFGFVLDGKVILKIDGKANHLTTGDSYYIPGGAVHEATFETFSRVVDIFADPNRYEIINELE
ncbi:MAG: cupin domain-containing protein [Candidatus Thorarchaeota archaeon]|jgi:quercetin dioxygenase-like cupin family protein